jgi:hypothetical protein
LRRSDRGSRAFKPISDDLPNKIQSHAVFTAFLRIITANSVSVLQRSQCNLEALFGLPLRSDGASVIGPQPSYIISHRAILPQLRQHGSFGPSDFRMASSKTDATGSRSQGVRCRNVRSAPGLLCDVCLLSGVPLVVQNGFW